MKKIATWLRRGWKRFGFVGAAIIVVALVNITLLAHLSPGSSARDFREVSEVGKLAGGNPTFRDLTNYFSDLANKKGAVYAYEILKRAPIPPNIDVHLLGHVVGDILYKQQGAKGILNCTQDFRNACSHSIVIGTLLAKGPGSFDEIADLCRQAPGGRGAYTMCFHGLGHGVLAYNEYELPDAVKMCEKLGQNGESSECIGGTIMEMIAGVHDRQVWEEKSHKYFKASDALYPCDAPFIPENAKSLCYTYLTPHLFQEAGANLGNPDPATFDKAFSYCAPLSGGDRSSCYGGFGKEFVVLAQNRDIRAIDTMTDEQYGKILDWCDKAKVADGKASCLLSAVNSIYWGGENDPKGGINFCRVADARGEGKQCFESFLGAVAYFESDPAYRARVCDAVVPAYQTTCKQRLDLSR